jgi:hypothetical protein
MKHPEDNCNQFKTLSDFLRSGDAFGFLDLLALNLAQAHETIKGGAVRS